jgi:hypothetical protein
MNDTNYPFENRNKDAPPLGLERLRELAKLGVVRQAGRTREQLAVALDRRAAGPLPQLGTRAERQRTELGIARLSLALEGTTDPESRSWLEAAIRVARRRLA